MSQLTLRDRIIFALDVPSTDLGLIRELLRTVCRHVGWVKVNSLFHAMGSKIVEMIRDVGARAFVDIKAHDIRFTNENIMFELGRMGAGMVTIHAICNPDSLKAAVSGAYEGAFSAEHETPILLGVTLLTDVGDADIAGVYGAPSISEFVKKMAIRAKDAGLHGIVCSGQEAADIRRLLGDEMLIVTPGIRFAGGNHRDQKRVSTPRAAMAAGADMLVMGSDLRKGNPVINMARAVVEIEAGLADRAAA